MAAGPIYNAIADLTLIGQKATLERIQQVSGATLAEVVTALKANSSRLTLNDGKIRLNPGVEENWSE